MSVASMKERFRLGPPVLISVHRALWGPLPENSIPAIEAGTRWEVVEVDISLDADGRAFLMHDDWLTRMTGNEAATDGASPELIASLRLREGAGGEGAAITDAHIPRLDEALAALEGTDAVFDLDVKRPADLGAVAEQVAALGGQDRATIKIDVLDTAGIAALKNLEAAHDVMVMAKVALRGRDDLETIRALREADQAVVETWFDDLALFAEACTMAGPGMRLGTYTLDPVHCCGLSDARALVDPDAVWGRLIEAGIGQIMTDQATALTAYMSRQGLLSADRPRP